MSAASVKAEHQSHVVAGSSPTPSSEQFSLLTPVDEPPMLATDITEGAFYAMEQAGILINNAVALYNRNSWSSGLVLGVFAWEELGKAEMLLQRGIDADLAGPKTREQVLAGANRHETKLKAGRGPITVIAPVISWGDIPEPNTQERIELEKRLDEAQKRALENAPSEGRAARMKALYVDLLPNGTWSRPKDIKPSEAYELISAVSIEYEVRSTKFANPTHAVVRRAVKELRHRIPTLPSAPRVYSPKP
jgi:AbiV family abortive infection protein